MCSLIDGLAVRRLLSVFCHCLEPGMSSGVGVNGGLLSNIFI